MSDKEFIIKVHVGGYPIPLKVARKDEEIYRKAEKLVADLIKNYHEKYNQSSYEDILKLVAYSLAVQVSNNELNKDPSPLADRLKAMEKEVDAILNQ